jgi:hypothetical protein
MALPCANSRAWPLIPFSLEKGNILPRRSTMENLLGCWVPTLGFQPNKTEKLLRQVKKMKYGFRPFTPTTPVRIRLGTRNKIRESARQC